MKNMSKFLIRIRLLVLTFLIAESYCFALPKQSKVVNGKASFETRDNQLNINASNNTIINYNHFNIKENEIVNITLPDKSSRILNRVEEHIPTYIEGKLLSNGNVYLSSKAGIFINNTAVIQTKNFFAIAGKISNEDFLNKINRFTDVEGSIYNEGKIIAENVLLIGKELKNNGQIFSENIMIAFSEDKILLQEKNKQFFIEASKQENSSAILEAKDIYSIVNTGEIQSNYIQINAASSTALISGTLKSNDSRDSTIQITGNKIDVLNANMDVSANDGAGSIYIGTNDTDHVIIDETSTLKANALSSGFGGNIVILSDEKSYIKGSLEAKGYIKGGFIETSSKNILDINSCSIDTSSVNGIYGSWLIDPLNITVQSMGINDTNIEFSDFEGESIAVNYLALNQASSNILLEATNNLTIDHSLDLNNDINLTAKAGNILTVNYPITSNKDITLTAQSTPYAQTNGKLIINSTLTSNSGDILLSTDNNLGSSSTIDLNTAAISGNNITFSTTGDINLLQSLSITANNDFTLNGDINTAVLNAGLLAVASHDIIINKSITTNNGSITFTGNSPALETNDGSIYIADAINTSSAPISLTLTGDGSIDVYGLLSSTGTKSSSVSESGYTNVYVAKTDDQYQTINNGLNAFDSVTGNLKIFVENNQTYNEKVIIDKDNLTITGSIGGDFPYITKGIDFSPNLSNILLSKLTVSRTDGDPILYMNNGTKSSITNLTINDCIFDGYNIADQKCFYPFNCLGDFEVTESTFQNILGLEIIDTSSLTGSPNVEITFDNNTISNCNGTVFLRTSSVNEITCGANIVTNIGGNNDTSGDQESAFYLSGAQYAAIAVNTIDNVTFGSTGYGNAFILDNLGIFQMSFNTFDNCYQGVYITGEPSYFPSSIGGINDNNIIFNTSQYAIKIDPTISSTGHLNINKNWFGSTSTPTMGTTSGNTLVSSNENFSFVTWLGKERDSTEFDILYTSATVGEVPRSNIQDTINLASIDDTVIVLPGDYKTTDSSSSEREDISTTKLLTIQFGTSTQPCIINSLNLDRANLSGSIQTPYQNNSSGIITCTGSVVLTDDLSINVSSSPTGSITFYDSIEGTNTAQENLTLIAGSLSENNYDSGHIYFSKSVGKDSKLATIVLSALYDNNHFKEGMGNFVYTSLQTPLSEKPVIVSVKNPQNSIACNIGAYQIITSNEEVKKDLTQAQKKEEKREDSNQKEDNSNSDNDSSSDKPDDDNDSDDDNTSSSRDEKE